MHGYKNRIVLWNPVNEVKKKNRTRIHSSSAYSNRFHALVDNGVCRVNTSPTSENSRTSFGGSFPIVGRNFPVPADLCRWTVLVGNALNYFVGLNAFAESGCAAVAAAAAAAGTLIYHSLSRVCVHSALPYGFPARSAGKIY